MPNLKAKYPRLENLGPDSIFCLEECLKALNDIKRMTLFYSDNHLRETLTEVNQRVEQTLKKVQKRNA